MPNHNGYVAFRVEPHHQTHFILGVTLPTSAILCDLRDTNRFIRQQPNKAELSLGTNGTTGAKESTRNCVLYHAIFYVPYVPFVLFVPQLNFATKQHLWSFRNKIIYSRGNAFMTHHRTEPLFRIGSVRSALVWWANRIITVIFFLDLFCHFVP